MHEYAMICKKCTRHSMYIFAHFVPKLGCLCSLVKLFVVHFHWIFIESDLNLSFISMLFLFHFHHYNDKNTQFKAVFLRVN